MHRTMAAVASEEDLGGKPLEAWDRCEEVNEDVDFVLEKRNFRVGLFSIEGHSLARPSQSKKYSRASGVSI